MSKDANKGSGNSEVSVLKRRITELEEELRLKSAEVLRYRTEFQKVNSTLEKLISDASHELRLAAILPLGLDIPAGVAGKAGANKALPEDFFARLAAHWKRAYTQHPAGWTAWVLSPDMKLPGAMRLKESRRVPMWNGPIECRLFRFDLVEGRAKPAP